MAELVYLPLVEEKRGPPTAVIEFLEPPAEVVLNSSGQHTLEWSEPLTVGDVTVPAGVLNLYTYPGDFRGPEEALIRRIIVELARKAPNLFAVPDPVGAYVIHATFVCNTDASLELSMEILKVLPRLLLQTHKGEPFSGEGCLHILCANRREALALECVEMAVASFSKEETIKFLTTLAVGVFFNDAPQRWYGDSPLAYACVFGLKNLVRRMLDTGLVSLNDNGGTVVGFYPLHAISWLGNRPMYDFLVDELPTELAADRKLQTQLGRLVELNTDGLSALSLAAKCGTRFMFQHVMKKELTTVLWVWGPVTQYQINLKGVDSSDTGAGDVMEILIREDAGQVTKELILDDFMGGFLFRLFQQKWAKFGWYTHVATRIVDAAVVGLVGYLCVALKTEEGERQMHTACLVLLGLLALFVLLESTVGVIYAVNYKTGVPPLELLRRTWSWMRSFGATVNLYACLLISAAIAIYFEALPALEGADRAPSDAALRARRRVEDAAVSSGGADGIVFDVESIVSQSEATFAYNVESARQAAFEGLEPLLWLLLSLGFLLKFYAFVDQAFMPFISLSTFMLSVRGVLKGELLTFMSIFLGFIGAFVFTMISMWPAHSDYGPLPHASEFLHWTSAAHALLMAGFTGEPLDLNLHPAIFEPLSRWQQLNLLAFFAIYVLYIFLALILLLNLLIALLGSTFSETQKNSTLQGRIAFARMVNRLELVASSFCIDTHAGEGDGSKYTYLFRSVEIDENNELPSDYKDASVFDKFPEKPVVLSA